MITIQLPPTLLGSTLENPTSLQGENGYLFATKVNGQFSPESQVRWYGLTGDCNLTGYHFFHLMSTVKSSREDYSDNSADYKEWSKMFIEAVNKQRV